MRSVRARCRRPSSTGRCHRRRRTGSALGGSAGQPRRARAGARRVAAAGTSLLRYAATGIGVAAVGAGAFVQHRLWLVAARQTADASRVDRHRVAMASAPDRARERASRSGGGEALAGRGAAIGLEESADLAGAAVAVGRARAAPGLGRGSALACVAAVAVLEDSVRAVRGAAQARARAGLAARAGREPPVARSVRLLGAERGADARAAGADFCNRGCGEAGAIGRRAPARRRAVVASSVGASGTAGRRAGAAATDAEHRRGGHGDREGRVRAKAVRALLHHGLSPRRAGLGSAQSHATCPRGLCLRQGMIPRNPWAFGNPPSLECARPRQRCRGLSRPSGGCGLS